MVLNQVQNPLQEKDTEGGGGKRGEDTGGGGGGIGCGGGRGGEGKNNGENMVPGRGEQTGLSASLSLLSHSPYVYCSQNPSIIPDLCIVQCDMSHFICDMSQLLCDMSQSDQWYWSPCSCSEPGPANTNMPTVLKVKLIVGGVGNSSLDEYDAFQTHRSMSFQLLPR